MRPLFSMDSLMVLGIDTRDVLPPLRSFFFFGFSTSAKRGVERDRCLRWWWWRWLVPPLLAPPTVPLAAPAVVLVRADSLSLVVGHLEKRETHTVCMYVGMYVCVDTLHPLPARQQFDSRPLAVPVQDWALRSTFSPLRATATPLRFANVKVLALCLNNTKTKRDLLNPCRPVIESFILFSLKKQTSWHVQTVLVSVLNINVFCEPSCPALFPPWLCDKLA